MYPLMNRLFSLSLLPTLALSAIISMSGCSSTSSGDKEGELGADGTGLSEADLAAQREGRFGSGSIPTAEGEGMFRDVHFDYDSAAIDDSARQDIEYNARVLQENSGMHIALEGHCDERGTNEYNMALGAERAKAVRNALVGLGVPTSRLDTISYGEEVPLDATPDESAYQKNRRVHLAGGAGGKGTTRGQF